MLQRAAGSAADIKEWKRSESFMRVCEVEFYNGEGGFVKSEEAVEPTGPD
jgi:hypothetical protein